MAIRRYHISCIAALACALVIVVGMHPNPVYAADAEQLGQTYQVAVGRYEDALASQSRNADEIAAINAQIGEKEQSLEQAREQLGETAVSLYKESCGPGGLIEVLLGSSSFHEASLRFDAYQKIQAHYRGELARLAAVHSDLSGQKDALEERKRAIESEVVEAKEAVDRAEDAYLNATHKDGATYQQTQGNSENCGAAAFTVAVNILLDEERYPDNVEVWKGEGFEGNSITNLAGRARTWLEKNGLADEISIEELRGDIHKAGELREQLEKGNVVVISSGADSVWQRADGSSVGSGTYSGGHWIVFYHYEDGVFYANDSAVGKALGAGCPYNEEQMQQWLDGRAYHFATVLSTL